MLVYLSGRYSHAVVVWESVALHKKYKKPSTTFEVSVSNFPRVRRFWACQDKLFFPLRSKTYGVYARRVEYMLDGLPSTTRSYIFTPSLHKGAPTRSQMKETDDVVLLYLGSSIISFPWQGHRNHGLGFEGHFVLMTIVEQPTHSRVRGATHLLLLLLL